MEFGKLYFTVKSLSPAVVEQYVQFEIDPIGSSKVKELRVQAWASISYNKGSGLTFKDCSAKDKYYDQEAVVPMVFHEKSMTLVPAFLINSSDYFDDIYKITGIVSK